MFLIAKICLNFAGLKVSESKSPNDKVSTSSLKRHLMNAYVHRHAALLLTTTLNSPQRNYRASFSKD